MRNITYQNIGSGDQNITIAWTFNDGNGDENGEQGTGGAKIATGTTTVTASGTYIAPITNSVTLTVPYNGSTTDVTFISPEGTSLLNVTNDPTIKNAGRIKLPLGNFGFDIEGLEVGQTITMSVIIDSSIGITKYYKKSNLSSKWMSITTNSVLLGGEQAGKIKIDFTLTDGGAFDSDGIANGTIVDPGGIGVDTLNPYIFEETTLIGDASFIDDTEQFSGTLSYGITGGEDADKFNIVAATGELSFKTAPSYDNPNDLGDTAGNNTYVVEVTVEGSISGSEKRSITVTVLDADGENSFTPDLNTPIIETVFEDVQIEEESGSMNYKLNLSDITADELNITVESNDSSILSVLPNWDGTLSFEEYSQGLDFNITTVPNSFGTVTVTVKATDENNYTAIKTFDINVTNVDDKPALEAISNITGIEEDGTINTITLNATDADGDEISYTASSSNTDIATVKIVDGKLFITPVANASGTITVEVNATANGQTTKQTFDVQIDSINDKPVFNTNLTDISITEDKGILNYELNVSDIEGDELNVTVTSGNTDILTVSKNWNEVLTLSEYDNIPLDFNISTVPNANGNTDITVTVNDGDKISTQIYTITVTPVNDAPVLSPISDIYVYKNSSTKSILLNATDIDGDDLSYSAVYGNSGLIDDINFTDNNMTVYISDELSGKSDINVTVSDGETNISRNFTFNVLSLTENDSVKNGGDVTVDENDTITVNFAEDNITVKAPTKANADGTISHEVNLGTKKVKATSEINGTKVELTDNGVHTVYEDTNKSVKAEVNATITGHAVHVLELNGTKTIAKSEIIGAKTTIKENNGSIEIETVVSNDDNISFKVTAKENGEAIHEVNLPNGKSSKAVSKVKGTQTVIKQIIA